MVTDATKQARQADSSGRVASEEGVSEEGHQAEQKWEEKPLCSETEAPFGEVEVLCRAEGLAWLRSTGLGVREGGSERHMGRRLRNQAESGCMGSEGQH